MKEIKENRQEKAYYQVIDYIKQLVKENKVGFGGKIPSERELISEDIIYHIDYWQKFHPGSTQNTGAYGSD